MKTVQDSTRRDVLAWSGCLASGAAFVSLLPAVAGRASPEAMQALVRRIVGEAPLQPGKVKLDIPPLVENGSAVPLTVSVESPMTEAEYVKAIHIVNEKNPQPHVIAVTLRPRAGRAQLATRIKLADSQRVTAIVELNDGSFWSGSTDVVVTLAACVENL